MELPSKQKPGPVLQNNGRTVPKAFQKLRAASPITCQVSVPGRGRTISKEGLWAPGGPWNSLPTLPHHSVPCIPVQPSLDQLQWLRCGLGCYGCPPGRCRQLTSAASMWCHLCQYTSRGGVATSTLKDGAAQGLGYVTQAEGHSESKATAVSPQ